jgi:Apea-like HEPN
MTDGPEQDLFLEVRPIVEKALAAGLRRAQPRKLVADFSHEFVGLGPEWNRGLYLGDKVFWELTDALQRIAAVKELEGATLYPGRMGAGERVEFGSIAWWVLERSLDVGALKALAEFDEFLSTKRGSSLWILLLSGIHLIDTVDLGGGIRLVPFRELPTSRQKRAFERYLSEGIFGGADPVALTSLRPLENLVLPAGSPGPQPLEDSRFGPYGWDDPDYVLEAISSLLCLVSPRAPYGFGAWVQSSGTGVPAQGALSFWRLPDRTITGAVSIDENAARQVIGQFMALDSDHRDHLLVPLSRLAQSLRHWPMEDAAIDLRTCLEALLIDRDQGEYAHRLSLRGAWILGATANDRRSIYGDLKKAYDIGSKAVHSGRVATGKGVDEKRKQAGDSIHQGQVIARKLLRRMIELGPSLELDKVEFGS